MSIVNGHLIATITCTCLQCGHDFAIKRRRTESGALIGGEQFPSKCPECVGKNKERTCVVCGSTNFSARRPHGDKSCCSSQCRRTLEVAQYGPRASARRRSQLALPQTCKACGVVFNSERKKNRCDDCIKANKQIRKIINCMDCGTEIDSARNRIRRCETCTRVHRLNVETERRRIKQTRKRLCLHGWVTREMARGAASESVFDFFTLTQGMVSYCPVHDCAPQVDRVVMTQDGNKQAVQIKTARYPSSRESSGKMRIALKKYGSGLDIEKLRTYVDVVCAVDLETWDLWMIPINELVIPMCGVVYLQDKWKVQW